MTQKVIFDGRTPLNNFTVAREGDELFVDLLYPSLCPEGCRYVVVNQMATRASDGIRLSYDYDRDGWSIEQASKFEWDANDQVCDRDWKEVAFIQSWAREEDQS